MSEEGDSDLQFNNGDEQFNQHDGEIQEASFQQGHQQHHMDVYNRGQSGDYDLDQSFEADEDALIRVKAKIMFNINKQRQIQQIPILYEDLTLTSIAMQYAKTIKRGSLDEGYLKRLEDQQKYHSDYSPCQIISKYEDDITITKKTTQDFFIQTAYVFFEMDNERQILMDPDHNHVGIGLAGNQSNIAVVILVTTKDLAITQITQTEEQRVQVKGKILRPNNFVFITEIYDRNNNQLACSMLDRVEYNRNTKDYIVRIDIKPNWDQKRWIQIFTTATEQPLGLKKPMKEKKNRLKKDLNDKFLSLFYQYPDERYIQYYNQEVEAQQNKQANLSGMLLETTHKEPEVKEEEKQYSESEKQQEEQSPSQGEDSESENKQQMSKEPKTSNRQIKQELQLAISQAEGVFKSIEHTNSVHQSKIKQIRQRNKITLDKIGEASMNQHKYLNILAQVHQTRMELQSTQERYNKMSFQLQNKLNDKQAKCNDIRGAFQDLKKQVARKATYSRSDQPIKPSKIEQWQQRESKLAQQLQTLRLQILRARNALAKNQKMLKKKQELAEGLHLIDFQQLKIENQTLNEKIQERNQDLHKLKKKTTTMVQILTHTRQKLVFVEKMKLDLQDTNKTLDLQIQNLRFEITGKKQTCEKLRLQIQDAKQQTEILNSQELVVDFKKRAQHIQKLDEELKQMLERQKEMKTVIQMYQRKTKKQALTR